VWTAKVFGMPNGPLRGGGRRAILQCRELEAGWLGGAFLI
jgi:hypothetical protein